MLSAVDPTQRETILPIGAFAQTPKYAVANAGYHGAFRVLATTNQDEYIMDVKLTNASIASTFDISKIKTGEPVDSNYLNTPLKKEDEAYLFIGQNIFFNFVARGSKEYQFECSNH